MDDLLRRSLMYDFYGSLLTKKQAEMYEMYYQDDYSLSEISERFGVSRQAVSDANKRTEKILEDYEKKLSLLSTHIEKTAVFERIKEMINSNIHLTNDEGSELIKLLEQLL